MRPLLVIAALATALVAAPGSAWPEPRLAVIVHPERTESPDAAELVRIYLKQRRFWQDGSAILPLNREAGNEEREAFSRRILGSASGDWNEYWNTRFFQGIFPPTTLSSDEAIKRYVAADNGAIGYIDASRADASVRVILQLP